MIENARSRCLGVSEERMSSTLGRNRERSIPMSKSWLDSRFCGQVARAGRSCWSCRSTHFYTRAIADCRESAVNRSYSWVPFPDVRILVEVVATVTAAASRRGFGAASARFGPAFGPEFDRVFLTVIAVMAIVRCSVRDYACHGGS